MLKFHKKFIIFFFVFSFFAVSFSPIQVFAQDGTTRSFLSRMCPNQPVDLNGDGTVETFERPTLSSCVNGIYKFVVRLSGVVALIALIFAGYIYMLAGGDGEKISKAKDLLWRVVQGVLILVIAYVFLKFLNPSLVELKDPMDLSKP